MTLPRLLPPSLCSRFGLIPIELSGETEQGAERVRGGVSALIKFEFPSCGRAAARLLSHHPGTLPLRRGSLASLIQPHCRMNNHATVT